MAVLNCVTGQIAPGRFDDWVAQGSEVKKIFERLGAHDSRLFLATVAGESTNSWSFTTEFDSAEAFGAFVDSTANDDEMQSLLLRLRRPDNPAIIQQQILATEIPLGRTPKEGRGSVVQTSTSQVVPGRLQDGLATAASALDFAEAHGAVNARLWQLSIAGMGSMATMVTWELESMRALGRLMDAFSSEPAGQELAASLYSADRTSVMTFGGVFAEIPI